MGESIEMDLHSAGDDKTGTLPPLLSLISFVKFSNKARTFGIERISRKHQHFTI